MFFILLTLFTNVVFADQVSDNTAIQNKDLVIWLTEDTEENTEEHFISPSKKINVKDFPSPSSYTEHLVLSLLNKYNIKLKYTSAKRINTEIKNSTNTCSANRIKTKERSKYAFFSTVQNIYLGHKLYRLAQVPPLPSILFNTRNELTSLSALFQHLPKLVLGIGDDTSYGEYLDDKISNLDKANIYSRGGSRRIFALNEMLFRKRVDFIIFYPSEISLITPQNQHLESYTISGSPSYILGHFSCSKSNLGKKVIADINKILSKAYLTEDFYNAYQQWLIASDMVKFNEYFKYEFGIK